MTTSLTSKENQRLNMYLMYGSDSYPITKMGRSWWVEGCPKAFKTKKAATEQWEAYIHLLLDKNAGRI